MEELYESAETYKNILKQNGINSEVKNVEINIPILPPGQLNSQCKNVTVLFTDETLPPLELFVKVPLTTGVYAEQIQESLFFEKEAMYYSMLLPDIKKFAEAQPGYDGFLDALHPKCYHAGDDLIVFENLVPLGFQVLEIQDLHNFNTATLALKNLATFHGTFHGFFQHIGEETFLSRYPLVTKKNMYSEEGEGVYGRWVQSVVDGAIQILSNKATPGSDEALEYIKQYETRGYLRLCEIFRRDVQACSMNLNHGDAWNGNYMFKVTPGSNKTSASIILDMQAIHLGSPAIDLFMYIFVSVDIEVRRTHWKKLLHIYYDHLEEVVVRKLGKQLKFSFEDLLSDLRTKSAMGLFSGMYAAFGIDALAIAVQAKGGPISTEGNVLENFVSEIGSTLSNIMEQKGIAYSQEIVKLYQEYLEISTDECI